MSRKEEIIDGAGLNYLYQTQELLRKNFVLGTLVRALGHGWKVLVYTKDKKLVDLLKKLKDILKQDLLAINNDADSKTRLVVVDSMGDLNDWRKIIDRKVHLVAVNIEGDFDLVTITKIEKLNKKGVLAITGEGKGKTTLGLGMSLEKILCEEEQIIMSWFKEKKNKGLSWQIGEHQFENKISSSFVIETTGLGFFGSPKMDRVKGGEAYLLHKQKAKEGVEKIKNKALLGYKGLIVLDEFVDTVKEIALNIEYPLVGLEEARNFLGFLIEKNNRVVVTGRRINSCWGDLVGESVVLEKVKHPWVEIGLPAVIGLDY